MNIIKWLLMVPVFLIALILTWILAFPLGLLSVVLGVNVLPGFLKWFHTHDNTMDGGQDDLGWPEKKGIGLVIQRASWMIRNPAYGFRATVLGFPSEGSKTVVHKGKYKAGEKGFYQIYTITSAKDKKYFGIRTNWCWFGWRHPQSGGYHIYKCGIRKP